MVGDGVSDLETATVVDSFVGFGRYVVAAQGAGGSHVLHYRAGPTPNSVMSAAALAPFRSRSSPCTTRAIGAGRAAREPHSRRAVQSRGDGDLCPGDRAHVPGGADPALVASGGGTAPGAPPLRKSPRARPGRGTGRAGRGEFFAQVLHFLGEVEAIFGIWVVPLLVAMTISKGWPTAEHYLEPRRRTSPSRCSSSSSWRSPSTRPVLRFAEQAIADGRGAWAAARPRRGGSPS